MLFLLINRLSTFSPEQQIALFSKGLFEQVHNSVRMKRTSSSHLACVSDSQTVERAYSHMHNLLPPQSFHYLRFSHMNISAMPKPEIVTLAPEYKKQASI